MKRANPWRPVKHPLRLCVGKGWSWGRGCLISPRGTVFEVRHQAYGLLARKRREFALNAE